MSDTDNKIKSYQPELQEKVFDRLREKYDMENETQADLYSAWAHVRFMLSLYLKSETGEGLVKGNRPLTEDQYNMCLKYLDYILPENIEKIKLW